MRILRRMVSMMLVLVFILSISVIPAHATSYSFWETRFRAIPQIASGTGEVNLVKAVQRFLYYFPETASRVRNAGGIDGSFGPTTKWAVERLQEDWYGEGSNQVDGIVGPNTWRVIPYYLDCSPSIYLLSYNYHDMYWIDENAYRYEYHTYDKYDQELWFFAQSK